MNFYLPQSDDYYLKSDLWKREREYLLSQECILFSRESANQHKLKKIFHIRDNDVKPRLNMSYKYHSIPYELDDMVANHSTDEIITRLVNSNISNDIFLASTNSNECCFISCGRLTEDILYNLSEHLNTPFIIFNEIMSFFVLIDFDLPLQVIGYKDKIVDEYCDLSNKAIIEGWKDVLQRYVSYTNLPTFLEEYYSFLLPNGFIANSK